MVRSAIIRPNNMPMSGADIIKIIRGFGNWLKSGSCMKYYTVLVQSGQIGFCPVPVHPLALEADHAWALVLGGRLVFGSE